MYLSSLTLEHFRNYQARSFRFASKATVLVGRNGCGKTNVLEAYFLLATGESFRAQRIEEMIGYGQELARISGVVQPNREAHAEQTSLELVLTRGELQGKRVAKRRYRVDGVSRRASDFVGKLVVVLFRPEDLQLVIGSPRLRRELLDRALMQVDREYRRSLASYEKALMRRNRLLDAIREGQAKRTQLAFWDQLLIKHGQLLTQKRRAFIEFINEAELSVDSFRVEYDASHVSQARFAQYGDQEVAVGYTLVGPHKDDFGIFATARNEQYPDTRGRDLALYGARGEQRLSVLWLKLAELSFVEKAMGERAVLLLDDVFSELDEKNRRVVLRLIAERSSGKKDSGRTIITTTDPGLIESKHRPSMRVVSLE